MSNLYIKKSKAIPGVFYLFSEDSPSAITSGSEEWCEKRKAEIEAGNSEHNSIELPKRIQRKRVKGWKMPGNTIYVGRPTKWGNPYNWKGGVHVGMTEIRSKGIAASMFKSDLVAGQLDISIEDVRSELKGKNFLVGVRRMSPVMPTYY